MHLIIKFLVGLPMNRLKELREDKDMTQEAVGRFLGVSKMAVSRYERGGASIPNDLIVQLCSFFGVTADYLLGVSAWKVPAVSKTDTALLSAYHAAPPEIRNIVDAALEPYKARASADSAAS